MRRPAGRAGGDGSGDKPAQAQFGEPRHLGHTRAALTVAHLFATQNDMKDKAIRCTQNHIGMPRTALRYSATPLRPRVVGLAAAIFAAALTLGCTTQQSSSPEALSTNQPLRLSPSGTGGDSGATGVALGEVDEAELAKALERYRIRMDRSQSPVRSAGVDLTGNGQPEAIALFTGEDWCTTTGCSFVVFQETPRGYEPVSRTTRVRGPVLVGPGSNSGWRDLIVKTGGGAAPVRFVRLGFTGDGYPTNALLQPGPREETIAQSTEVLPDDTLKAAQPQASSAR